jgi:IclR family transcriptional regulator, KDG regulon repressor
VKPDRSIEPAPGPRYMVDAAAKALSLLDAFTLEEPSLSLSALMERTGLPRATAFRLLATLEQCGYVVKDGVDYSLGFKLFVLGNVVAEGLDLRRVSHRHLEALRDATGETVQLAVLEDWQIVHLDRAISNQAVAYMVSHVGAILPAYCTALGKALLAYQSEDLVDAWASTQELRRHTSNTITTAEGLLEELRRIRDRGYSIDDEEREVGVRCVGAPVFDRAGGAIAAISLGAPTGRLPRTLEGSGVATQVVATALAISRELGHVRRVGGEEPAR